MQIEDGVCEGKPREDCISDICVLIMLFCEICDVDPIDG